MPVDEVHQRRVMGNDRLGLAGAARGEGDVGRLPCADRGQLRRWPVKRMQCLDRVLRHSYHTGVCGFDVCLATAQDYPRCQAAGELLQAGGRVGRIGHAERPPGAQAAKHRVDQRRAPLGNNQHTIVAIDGYFQQIRSDTLADLRQLGVRAKPVRGDDCRGFGAALCLLQEGLVNRLLGAVLQAQRRVRAQVRHDGLGLRMNVLPGW